ncbi:hypothetical protein Tco_1078632 [Tanacetum coccineum]|uniref:Uncharacterized protein n=1 Tax=Tanacetum coccineum TaxID=301880 RepID=A0ABQ5HR64_9ASTR
MVVGLISAFVTQSSIVNMLVPATNGLNARRLSCSAEKLLAQSSWTDLMLDWPMYDSIAENNMVQTPCNCSPSLLIVEVTPVNVCAQGLRDIAVGTVRLLGTIGSTDGRDDHRKAHMAYEKRLLNDRLLSDWVVNSAEETCKI